MAIDSHARLASRFEPDQLGGVVTVNAVGAVSVPAPALYRPFASAPKPGRDVRLTAVPYFGWANRAPGAMRVWIPRI